MAKSIISQLKEKGKVTRGWIGVSVQSLTPEMAQAFGLREPKGALVGEVVPGGPADVAGIKRGDIVVSFNGKEIKNMSDLPTIVAETPVGKTVDMKIIRGGKEMNLKITVAEMTEERLASYMRSSEESIGITVDDIKPRWQREFGIKDRGGVVVVDVATNSPADDAGINIGDVVKEVNRKPIRNIKDYESAMQRSEKGKPLLLLIKRGAQTFYLTVQIS
jgi:serine protease Do